MCKHLEGCQRTFGERCLKPLPPILMRIHYCLIQTHPHMHTHRHILIQCTSIWQQTPPLSPMPQCLPITKEVINSTTAPSREIDFNDTSYMAAVSVPDSHLHTSRDPASRLSAALHRKAKQDEPQPAASQWAARPSVSYITCGWLHQRELINSQYSYSKFADPCFTHWWLSLHVL